MLKPPNRFKLKDIVVLLIEFQKTWTERSFFHKLIRKQYESKNVYQNTLELLEVARNRGVKVIQAPFILDKSIKENYKKIPLPPKLFGQFTANTWRAEYTEGIYSETDLEVSGRCGFDACIGSNLQQILKNHHTKKIYFAGFTTDHCVSDTMSTLLSDGYECILISDCTATRNSNLQEKVEKKYQTILSEEFIKEIEKLV